MIRLSWHPFARMELFEASAFYEEESAGLGEIFLDAVQEGAERLELHPHAGPQLLREIRGLLVGRFPYTIIYRGEGRPTQDRIFILAIAHQSRQPRSWANRI